MSAFKMHESIFDDDQVTQLRKQATDKGEFVLNVGHVEVIKNLFDRHPTLYTKQ